MGLISEVLTFLFGGGRNVVRETTEVFRQNAENAAVRDLTLQQQAMLQFGTEFRAANKSRYDRVLDGLNRLPRPALALGALGLFVAAMVDPLWFAARMQGVSLVPEPLWWLLGVIVSFYFGTHHQAKAQDLQRELSAAIKRAPQVMENIRLIEGLRTETIGSADPGTDAELAENALRPDANRALEDWRHQRSG
ncbi:holin family protein [Ruegeria sp. HKCCA5426]|uniref:holin family protein n=1 Tax=Ruegeria sp. HKCCA5426 TaxID=2682985 RepID=UPI00148789FD|nr:holin family protein [Ruegeria sp. HKCCA5426]